ncbi:helix-turn-helix domain-containing protein [Caminicella sporogenes]|uniref:helix-turn-helix domain-containing protein n=1 Tax=Caminicella sporogenes TaxID=166485 RepID=UPI0025403611|nr:helix-turn-helix transcriptional regulator [Caminicella sporogenes]WIF94456.1 helix-turn-helix transcriptional regulator [Caminicella sporogenes]
MVGKRIRKLRKERGLSLKELSKKTDISISFLSDIENGRSNPSLERLKDIARGLNTTVSYLLGETDDIQINSEIKELLSNPEFLKILDELKDFNSWSDEDKSEFLAYIKAKRMIRNSK